MKRMQSMSSAKVNPLVDGEEDFDLNFVVEGDFFDGEEF